MTEQKAMNKVQELVTLRRKNVGLGHAYCSKCHNLDARYVTTDLWNGTSECEECYAKRMYDELSAQITKDNISEIKNERVQNVKNYFQRKKLEFKV